MYFTRAAALLSLAVSPALLVAGCSNDDDEYTDHYAINQINGSFGAFADETNMRVLAAFLAEGGFLKLRSGDTVEVDVNGARASTYQRELEDKVHYVVDMPPPPGETEVVITFVRGTERVVGKARIAAAFDFVSPPTTAKLNQALDVDLDPRPDLSKWPGFFGPALVAKAEIKGDCLESGQQNMDLCGVESEPGKCTQGYPLRIDLGKLIYRPNTTSCELAVQVRLTAGGSKYEGTGPKKETFAGGGFESYRAKAFKVTVTP